MVPEMFQAAEPVSSVALLDSVIIATTCLKIVVSIAFSMGVNPLLKETAPHLAISFERGVNPHRKRDAANYFEADLPR